MFTMIKDKNEKGFYHGNIENFFRQNQGILGNTTSLPILVNGGAKQNTRAGCSSVSLVTRLRDGPKEQCFSISPKKKKKELSLF